MRPPTSCVCPTCRLPSSGKGACLTPFFCGFLAEEQGEQKANLPAGAWREGWERARTLWVKWNTYSGELGL